MPLRFLRGATGGTCVGVGAGFDVDGAYSTARAASARRFLEAATGAMGVGVICRVVVVLDTGRRNFASSWRIVLNARVRGPPRGAVSRGGKAGRVESASATSVGGALSGQSRARGSCGLGTPEVVFDARSASSDTSKSSISPGCIDVVRDRVGSPYSVVFEPPSPAPSPPGIGLQLTKRS